MREQGIAADVVGQASTAAVASSASIHGAARGDPKHKDNECSVLDCVDDAVVADADPPEIWIPDKNSIPARAWVEAQRIDGLEDAAGDRLVEPGQLLESLRVIFDSERRGTAHSPSARATSSAGTVFVRPASRSASRSIATRPSSLSIIAS